jgi:hypothetical protein
VALYAHLLGMLGVIKVTMQNLNRRIASSIASRYRSLAAGIVRVGRSSRHSCAPPSLSGHQYSERIGPTI